jgi:GcrA cell cycle regulator
MADAATWTDERVEQLKKLWADGLSASQIAAQIGGVTRNAVIGKVHRLGLSGRNKTTAPQPQRVRKPARPPSVTFTAPAVEGNIVRSAEQRFPTTLEQEERLPDDIVIPVSERVTIMELRESMCRWPMGDPTTPEFRFCGQRAIAGLPYCTHHARVAYQPAAERKRDRRIAMRA